MRRLPRHTQPQPLTENTPTASLLTTTHLPCASGVETDTTDTHGMEAGMVWWASIIVGVQLQVSRHDTYATGLSFFQMLSRNDMALAPCFAAPLNTAVVYQCTVQRGNSLLIRHDRCNFSLACSTTRPHCSPALFPCACAAWRHGRAGVIRPSHYADGGGGAQVLCRLVSGAWLPDQRRLASRPAIN